MVQKVSRDVLKVTISMQSFGRRMAIDTKLTTSQIRHRAMSPMRARFGELAPGAQPLKEIGDRDFERLREAPEA